MQIKDIKIQRQVNLGTFSENGKRKDFEFPFRNFPSLAAAVRPPTLYFRITRSRHSIVEIVIFASFYKKKEKKSPKIIRKRRGCRRMILLVPPMLCHDGTSDAFPSMRAIFVFFLRGKEAETETGARGRRERKERGNGRCCARVHGQAGREKARPNSELQQFLRDPATAKKGPDRKFH